MEAFFASALQYHPSEASVTSVSTTATWPPRIAASGYAPTLRGWAPHGNKANITFAPTEALSEVDGSRQIAMDLKGDVLVSADSSSVGNVSIWDVTCWERKQTVQADGAIASLALSEDFLVVGTMIGKVRVWCRPKRGLISFERLYDNDFNINPMNSPCRIVLIGEAPDGTPLLVVQSAEMNRIGVWRLVDGKLVHELTRPMDPENIAPSVLEANVTHAIICETVLAMVSWVEGADPLIRLIDVISQTSSHIEAPERLQGRRRPMCADFDGAVLVIGFEDGALAAFGFKGWLRFHAGSVGAVKIVGAGSQAVSGSADKTVRLWSIEGGKPLATFDIGFQVTSMSAGDVFAVVGGNRGEVQLVVLAQEGGDRSAGAGLPDHSPAPASKPEEYVMYFDSRPDKDCMRSSTGSQGRASDNPSAFDSFVQRFSPVSGDTLILRAVEQAAKAKAAAEEGGEQGGGSRSGFNSNAALKGADSKTNAKTEKELAEEKKRNQLKQMGETGVARSVDASLESSSSRVGRKCDNGNCLVREGLGVAQFKRCGACRLAWYCSAHCQRTHWRDGHSKDCARLKEEAQQRLQADRPATMDTAFAETTTEATVANAYDVPAAPYPTAHNTADAQPLAAAALADAKPTAVDTADAETTPEATVANAYDVPAAPYPTAPHTAEAQPASVTFLSDHSSKPTGGAAEGGAAGPETTPKPTAVSACDVQVAPYPTAPNTTKAHLAAATVLSDHSSKHTGGAARAETTPEPIAVSAYDVPAAPYPTAANTYNAQPAAATVLADHSGKPTGGTAEGGAAEDESSNRLSTTFDDLLSMD